MRQCLACIAIAIALGACSATEGPLLIAPAVFAAGDAGSASDASSAGDAGSAPPGVAVAGPIRGDMRLQYQLVGELDSAAQAELFVVDLFNTTASDVAELHALGRVVVGYVAAGSHEPFRPDADAFPASALGAPLPGYPEESWLDVRDPEVRQLMQQRVELAAERGFDGLFFSSLTAYQHDSGFALSAADQLDYNLWLADQAHTAGLLSGLADDFVHAGELADAFDFAIHSGCLAADRCAELAPFTEAAKPVFDLETTGDLATICAEAARLGLSVTLKMEGYDAWLRTCP